MTSRSLEMRPAGLFCPPGDFYIDPWRPVHRAVITHAHSDHARWGSNQYLSVDSSVRLLTDRLGRDIAVTGLKYGESIQIGSVRLSFHPAGHILGSSQIRIENAGHVSLITGDYKRDYDPTCSSFEPLPAHCLVTESTFGLPVFRWSDPKQTAEEINSWWIHNQSAGVTSILYGYALGKSQRILNMLDSNIGPIFIHGALQKPIDAYREAGVQLPKTKLISQATKDVDFSHAMVLAVPSVHGTSWINRFRNRSTAMVSGWMQIRGNRRRRSTDRGFVLSDHADWDALIKTVQEVAPEEVWVTHGFADVFSRHLRDLGWNASPLKTEFLGESTEDQETATNPAGESL
ncbi:MAG: ligase-associated DNA damage response exonuclease [Pirellula sp.]|jgi:putative mRNA 3-end processing factor